VYSSEMTTLYLLLTGTLIALIANAPNDHLTAVAQSHVKILLSNELMIGGYTNLFQHTAQKNSNYKQIL